MLVVVKRGFIWSKNGKSIWSSWGQESLSRQQVKKASKSFTPGQSYRYILMIIISSRIDIFLLMITSKALSTLLIQIYNILTIKIM